MVVICELQHEVGNPRNVQTRAFPYTSFEEYCNDLKNNETMSFPRFNIHFGEEINKEQQLITCYFRHSEFGGDYMHFGFVIEDGDKLRMGITVKE